MFPLVTSALSILSKTKLGERVTDKVGSIVQNIGKRRRKNRAGDVNQTADINAMVADTAPLYASNDGGGTIAEKLGKAIKAVKDGAGPIETENVVKVDKSMYILGAIIGGSVLLYALSRK